MATRQEVDRFLGELGSALTLNYVFWIPRVETSQNLIDLGINQKIAQELLAELTHENYSSGPVPDITNSARSIWVFGLSLDGHEVYVKLALQADANRRTVVNAIVWSFHIASHPLSYPLR